MMKASCTTSLSVKFDRAFYRNSIIADARLAQKKQKEPSNNLKVEVLFFSIDIFDVIF
jgi:hypothetical protein